MRRARLMWITTEGIIIDVRVKNGKRGPVDGQFKNLEKIVHKEKNRNNCTSEAREYYRLHLCQRSNIKVMAA